jgi:hypothetical protein
MAAIASPAIPHSDVPHVYNVNGSWTHRATFSGLNIGGRTYRHQTEAERTVADWAAEYGHTCSQRCHNAITRRNALLAAAE